MMPKRTDDDSPPDGIAALWQRAMRILKEQMSSEDYQKINSTLTPVLEAAGADPASLAADSMTRAEKFHRAFPIAARLR